MRLIDADAFKEYCKTGLDETKTMIRSGSMRAFAEELTEAFIRDIDEQPTVPQWIPVTVEPHEDDDCICTFEDSNGNFVGMCCYDSIQGWGFYPDDGDDFLPVANVIAWMPFPEVYKEVGNG